MQALSCCISSRQSAGQLAAPFFISIPPWFAKWPGLVFSTSSAEGSVLLRRGGRGLPACRIHMVGTMDGDLPVL